MERSPAVTRLPWTCEVFGPCHFCLVPSHPPRSALDASSPCPLVSQGCRIQGDRTVWDRSEQCSRGRTVRGGFWLWCCNCAGTQSTAEPVVTKWEDLGAQRPEAGAEVTHDLLATALHIKAEFSDSEFRRLFPSEQSKKQWLASLKPDSYIRVSAGLKWMSAGNRRPAEGRELVNDQLSLALRGKTSFTQHEWDAFGIKELRSSDYILCRAAYFKPASAGDRFFRPVSDTQACQHCENRAKAHRQGKTCASPACLHCKTRAAGLLASSTKGPAGEGAEAEQQLLLLQAVPTEQLEQELARRRGEAKAAGGGGAKPRGVALKTAAHAVVAGLAMRGRHAR